MSITRSIKSKLDTYGVNLPTDRRTRAYSNILRKNNWTDETYKRHLKDVIKGFVAKEKKIVSQVARNKIIEKVAQSVKDKKKVRYTGSTLVEVIIFEGKTDDDDKRKKDPKDDNLTSRQQTNTKNIFIEFHTLSFDKRVSNIKEIDSIVKYKVQKLQRRISMRPYVIDVVIDSVKQSIHKYTNVEMTNIRMKQSGSYNIDGYTNQDWDTQQDKCVYDYIIYTYGKLKGFKKQCNDYKTLEEIFDNGDSLIIGVNTDGIRNWCEHFRVSMHGFDDEERRFSCYLPENRNTHAPSMMFRVSDGHFYPIPENKRKSVLTINTQIDAGSEVIYDFKAEEKELVPITDIVILENTNPMLEISKSIIETKTKPTQISVVDGNIQSYKLNGITYTINKFIPFAKIMCINMKLDYTGQSLGNILNIIITETVKQINKSHHNPNVFDSLELA